MKKLKHDLLTNKYTEVYHEKDFKFNAPHKFKVTKSYSLDGEHEELEVIQEIHFQEGAIKEHGVNGVMNEDLISMIICRLDHFQETDFACYENDMAIMKLEEALMWLRKRSIGREQRGVEGTYIK